MYSRLLSVQSSIGNRALARILAGNATSPAQPAAFVQRQDEEGSTGQEGRDAFERGREAYTRGQYAEAIRHFETAFGTPGLSSEDMADLVWNMAICRARLGDVDGAMTDAMTYGQYAAGQEQQLVQAIQTIVHGPVESPGGEEVPETADDARSAFQQGETAYANGEYEAAIRHFEQALGAPGLDQAATADLVWNIALCRARMGDEDGAMTDAMTYGQYAPEHQQQLVERIRSIVHGGPEETGGTTEGSTPQTDEEAREAFERGRQAYDAGRYEEALRQYEAALAAPGLEPSRVPGLIWNTAVARARLGDVDGAMTDAMTYGQYRSNQDELVQTITLLVHGPPGETAAEGAAPAPQTDEEARAAFELGRQAYDAGRYEEALGQFEAALAAPGLEPSRMPELIWNTAVARARLGDIDGAMTDAMTYGQYRGNQEDLIQLIQRLGHGGSAGPEAGEVPAQQ